MEVTNITNKSMNILATYNSFSIDYTEKLSFISTLKELTYRKKVLFTCIGSDRATGDCLGPLVGTNLKRLGYTVIGTLDEPLHAQNLVKNLERAMAINNPDIVVAIDACLGKHDEIGKISLSDSPLSPGAALNKSLPTVGDISILGIVNMGGFLELQVLQCTRLHTVMKLATDMTHLIWRAVPVSQERQVRTATRNQCS